MFSYKSVKAEMCMTVVNTPELQGYDMTLQEKKTSTHPVDITLKEDEFSNPFTLDDFFNITEPDIAPGMQIEYIVFFIFKYLIFM